jgi:ABC-type multidrug transport system fused ATPase/permease subunit
MYESLAAQRGYSYCSKAALNDVTFKIEAGECVAINGPSGAGKSTLGSSLCVPQILRLEGRPLTEYALASLRSAVCYVPQHPVLFLGSIRENLRYANPHANIDEMYRAIQAVQLQAVIDNLPQGLDAPLGPGAASLSGGERQRLALARSLEEVRGDCSG